MLLYTCGCSTGSHMTGPPVGMLTGVLVTGRSSDSTGLCTGSAGGGVVIAAGMPSSVRRS